MLDDRFFFEQLSALFDQFAWRQGVLPFFCGRVFVWIWEVGGVYGHATKISYTKVAV
jgi:hypothetical protein